VMPLDGLLRLLSRREETVQARIEEIEADETHVGQTYREFLNDFDLELLLLVCGRSRTTEPWKTRPGGSKCGLTSTATRWTDQVALGGIGPLCGATRSSSKR
jgi:hypothetical protein